MGELTLADEFEQTQMMEALSDATEEAGATSPCLVAFAGKLLGQTFPIEKDEIIIGRVPENDVVVPDKGVSRKHCRVVRRKERVFIQDLKSTNGTLVNELPVAKSELRDGDFVKIGAAVFQFTLRSATEACFHEELYKLTTIDSQTGTFNRRHFDNSLTGEIARAERYQRCLTLGMIRIHEFQKVSPEFDIETQQKLLNGCAAVIKSQLRQNDVVARYSDEVFAIIIPEVSQANAELACAKVVKAVEEQSFEHKGNSFSIGICLGTVSTHPTQNHRVHPDAMLKAATEALDSALNMGAHSVQHNQLEDAK